MSDAGLGIALAVDAAGATVIVNTVVLVRAGFDTCSTVMRWRPNFETSASAE